MNKYTNNKAKKIDISLIRFNYRWQLWRFCIRRRTCRGYKW